MKKTLDIVKVISLILVSLVAFHVLHFYFPSNIISKVLKAAGVVLTPILIALVILYLVNPFTRWLINKKGFSKRLAIVVTMLLFFVLIVGLIGFVIYFIIDKGVDLYNQVMDPSFIDSIRQWFYRNNMKGFFDSIEEYVGNIDLINLIGPVSSIFGIIAQTVTTLILVPIFLWHFLNYDENVINGVKSNIPNKWHKTIIPLVTESNDIVSAYFRSKIISMFALFLMFVVTYLILGIPLPYVILFAFLISILDIVPYIGPAFGLIVPIIYIFSVGGTELLYLNSLSVNAIIANIILLGINVVIQFIQGNIIIPVLSGKEMDISPVLILVFILFLGYILGIWGVVLAIPLGGIIIVVWEKIKELDFFKDESEKEHEEIVVIENEDNKPEELK